ncbi:MAG: glycosyltransferase family 4 protein [Thermodesulfovibrionales bacterium]|nr:glycosyltransferase family 4 protein [Thermodesulfovibrionales bacterium]
MKVAIVHDWLVTPAGAERVLEEILEIYPEADLFSLIDFLPVSQRYFIKNKKVQTSFIQNLPFAKKKYRSYLPLMPFAVEQFNLSGYDLIISSSHAVAKGILTNSNQLHICYCYTPMRYAWELYHQYLKESELEKGMKAFVVKAVLHYLRIWDHTTVNRVDHFVTLSKYVANRIRRVYGREAKVIYPPVDIEKFQMCSEKDNFFLTASRMVPYKKIDLIAEAFSETGLPLIVIGDGPDFEKVKRKAKKNVTFLGYQKDDTLKEYLQKARAFIFAAEEDFGILPVEAQACGTPVIAYGAGGILETVAEGKTGIFFKEQTVESLIEAINEFQKRQDQFDCLEIRRNAERFSRERFKEEFKEFVDRKILDFFQ